MVRKKWAAAAAAGVAAVSLVLSACGGGSSSSGSSGSSGSGGTLTLGLLVAATTFEANDMNWANEAPYGQAVYDTLLQASPTGKIQPHLATAWSLDDAKTTLTLTLRKGVKFTDGSSFDADVAAQNLERFKKGTSANASFLANMASATAVDATHVKIALSQPDPAFTTYLTQAPGLMESAKAFGNSDVKTVPVGSGPYELDKSSTVAGSSYAFTANKGYWDKSQQHYSKIVMNVYSSGTALLKAIQGGQVNAANTFDNSTLAQIKGAGFTVEPYSLNWQGVLLMDRAGTQVKALADPRVRQAINYAFDRKALLKAVGNGYGTVTSQIFPPTSPSYEKSLDSYYTYDPAKAKQLLAQAGYPNGFTLPMPTISALGASTYALVKQELGDVGITVQETDMTINQVIPAILAAKYPASYFILQEDPTDWQLTQFQVAKNATWNPFHAGDDTVDGYLKTIQTGSTSDAATAGKSLNEYLVKNGWFAPWFRPQGSIVSDSSTKVTTQAGNAYPYLWNIQPKS